MLLIKKYMIKEKIVVKLFRIRVLIIKILSTLIAYVKCWFWGVKIGKECNFVGSILIYKEPGSTIKIGENCRFSSSSYTNFRGLNHKCILQTGQRNASIIIGDNCGFSGTSIVCNSSVLIGNNCVFGANVNIGDRDGHRDRYATKDKMVCIGQNTWLGMNVTVLKGVSIGMNCVIGANSLVTKDIPDNVVAAGNPAKILKYKQ